jgi:thiol-disulfide isomerase/thioredoxin
MQILRWCFVFCLAVLPSSSAQSAQLKVEPLYPVMPSGEDAGTKELRVTYFPRNPQAKINDPLQLELKIGMNGRFWRDNTRSVPFVRQEGGSWEATLSRSESDVWFYLVFMVKDEKTGAVDDNAGHFWDVVFRNLDGTLNASAVEMQAESYTGVDFGNGIARKEDYSTATAILDKYLAGHDPGRYNVLFRYWQYKLQAQGESEGAWRQISNEIDQFMTDHQFDEGPLINASGFILNHQEQLQPTLLPRNLNLIARLDPEEAEKVHRMAIFAWIRHVRDRRKRAEDLGVFVRKYPQDQEATRAANERFQILRDLGDVAGAESAFQQSVEVLQDWADNYAAMAAVYIENKVKLERAQELLDKAQSLMKVANQQPGDGRYYLVLNSDAKSSEAVLAYWRARLYLLQGKGELALPLAEQGVADRKNSDREFVLAQALEAGGQKDKALDAYLESVLVPSRDQRERMERLQKFWIGADFGNSDELFEKIEKLQQERFKNAHYVPALVDRPLPDFEFTTLKGDNLRSSNLRDKTIVLNFWATWCAPCIPELRGFQELQSKHPELVVAAIAVNSDPSDLDKLILKQKLDLLRIARTDNPLDAFVPNGVPVTYVVEHGRIRVVHRSALSDVVAYIEADLAAMKSQVAAR